MLDGMGDPTPPWREPFEQALDADPSDQRVRRDLADHLDEIGDPDGEAVRWLAENGKWPQQFIGGHNSGWFWWRHVPPEAHVIGHELHSHLITLGAHPTRREAEADFCRGWHAARADGWVPDSG
jgi:hypothetical protein